VGGVLWTTAANVGSRVLTIFSTFFLTRYLAPAVQGEVNLAYVFVSTAGAATGLGVGPYLAANPKEGRDTAFHGSVLILGVGVLACLACIATGPHVADWLHVPGMLPYVPGLALGHYLDRCGWVPRGLLVREMRFRALGLRATVGELTFAVCSVAFAYSGRGGFAIVYGNIARGAVNLALLFAVTSWRDYLLPCRLAWPTMVKLLRFGVPLTIASLFTVGAMTWDNSFMGWRFGEATVGIYNQAYRLAELPATSVGDHINDVLVPTFAQVDGPVARRRGFFRAASLMALVVFPMALGLGAIAPTLVHVFYPASYAGVGPYLVVLATLSISRSIGNLAGAFLQVVGRTRAFVLIDLILVVTVLGFMAILARWGSVWASAGVGIAFLISVVLTLRVLRPDGITPTATFLAVLRPLLACLPMVAVVLGLRYGLRPLALPGVVQLLAELLGGAAAYVAAAFAIAPKITRDFIELAMSTVRRRARKEPPGDQDAPAKTGG
jgi:lipopolysaccharide exporter